MSLSDIINLRKKLLLNNVYPEYLRNIVEADKRSRTIVSKLSIYDFKPYKGKIINSNFYAYIEQIERANRSLPPRKIFSTISQITELAYINYDLLDLLFQKQEKNEIIIDESQKTKKIITDIYKDNLKLFTIESREFEELIAELLLSQGFKVELTGKTRDNGYDIIAIKHIDEHNPLKFLVECKRYTKQKVGVEIIRSFKEVIDTEKANRGIIVTTSYFTKGAIKKQKEIPYLLDYKDKDNVINWINAYYTQKIINNTI
jgi:restriction endonuclease Mrr